MIHIGGSNYNTSTSTSGNWDDKHWPQGYNVYIGRTCDSHMFEAVLQPHPYSLLHCIVTCTSIRILSNWDSVDSNV